MKLKKLLKLLSITIALLCGFSCFNSSASGFVGIETVRKELTEQLEQYYSKEPPTPEAYRIDFSERIITQLNAFKEIAINVVNSNETPRIGCWRIMCDPLVALSSIIDLSRRPCSWFVIFNLQFLRDSLKRFFSCSIHHNDLIDQMNYIIKIYKTCLKEHFSDGLWVLINPD